MSATANPRHEWTSPEGTAISDDPWSTVWMYPGPPTTPSAKRRERRKLRAGRGEYEYQRSRRRRAEVLVVPQDDGWGTTASPPCGPELVAPAELRKLAADAASMLRCVSETAAADDESLGEAHWLLVRDAAAAVAEIQSRLRVVIAGRNGDMERVGRPAREGEGIWIDAACVVCLAEVTGQVLMPCGHLALCTGCFEKLGVEEMCLHDGDRFRCPVCRSDVFETVRVLA